MNASDRLLTPPEAAKLLGLTVKALDHRRRAGEIPFKPLGRLIRYRLHTLEAFMAEGEIQLPRRPRKPATVSHIKEVRR